ncbi:MAG: lysyl oxidase family protein [Thermoanaerobaculia bacterium]
MRLSKPVFAALCLTLAVAVAAPVLAQGLPDLIVREDIMTQQWVVRDENLPANYCSVVEGGVTPGWHRIVRFTVMTANVGDGDINVGDPKAHYDANDGLFELAICHQHFHFRNYASYELIDPRTGRVWKAAKRGFCMLDTDPNPAYMGEAPRDPQFRSCGDLTHDGNQGISHGWTDTYRFYLGGQYFVLDGGDGQPVVPPGDYLIRITANPPYKGTKESPCRFLDPATGLCHALRESDYSNNVGQVLVSIPDHPGQGGVGPLAGSATVKETPEH